MQLQTSQAAEASNTSIAATLERVLALVTAHAAPQVPLARHKDAATQTTHPKSQSVSQQVDLLQPQTVRTIMTQDASLQVNLLQPSSLPSKAIGAAAARGGLSQLASRVTPTSSQPGAELASLAAPTASRVACTAGQPADAHKSTHHADCKQQTSADEAEASYCAKLPRANAVQAPRTAPRAAAAAVEQVQIPVQTTAAANSAAAPGLAEFVLPPRKRTAPARYAPDAKKKPPVQKKPPAKRPRSATGAKRGRPAKAAKQVVEVEENTSELRGGSVRCALQSLSTSTAMQNGWCAGGGIVSGEALMPWRLGAGFRAVRSAPCQWACPSRCAARAQVAAAADSPTRAFKMPSMPGAHGTR